MAAGVYQAIVPWDLEFIRQGTIKMLEPASFTQKRGTPVIFSSGVLAVAGTGFTTGLVGFLAEDGHNAAAQREIEVWPARLGVLYEISLLTAIADNLRGVAMGLLADGTTGFWYADNADTVDQVKYIRPVEGWATGDTKSRGLFQIAAATFIV